MKYLNTRRGFTLIELLVVILIIGILAAVAVPQYQKSVYRSRYATLKYLVKSIVEAQEVYYLANNEYAEDFDQLDVDMPKNVIEHEYEEGTNIDKAAQRNRWYNWGCCYLGGYPTDHISCINDRIEMAYQIYFSLGSNPNAGQIWCVDYTNNPTSLQSQICKSETGQLTPRQGNFLTYKY